MPRISHGARMPALADAAPAVVHEGRVLRRAELERRARRLARVFVERGVAEGDRVVIALPNALEWFWACLAAWKLGAVPIPPLGAAAGAGTGGADPDGAPCPRLRCLRRGGGSPGPTCPTRTWAAASTRWRPTSCPGASSGSPPLRDDAGKVRRAALRAERIAGERGR